jgi:hypothetical protein
MLQLVEQSNEVPEIAAEAIERGHGDEIEAPTPRRGKQRVQARALLPGATHCVIRELCDDRPPGALGMFVEGAKLILGGLVARADARVQGNALRVLWVVRHVVLLRG